MRLLLDARALLWSLTDHPRLSPKARSSIGDQGNDLLISVATCWGIALKVSLGKLKLTQPYAPFMESALTAHQIEVLPIGLQHVSKLADLPFHHWDLFDRMVAVQVLNEMLPVVSMDPALDFYGVQRLW